MNRMMVGLLGLGLMSCVPSKAEIKHAQPDTRTPVEVLTVKVGPIVEQGRYFGSLEPRLAATITAEVGGKILATPVDEGAKVKKGDLLIQLDEEQFRLAEEQAQAGVEASKVRVEQMEASLAVQRKTLQAQVDQAEALVTIAKARVSAIEKGARYEERKQVAAALDVAKVAVDNGKLELERVKNLLEANAATQQQYDSALANFQSGEARYNQALQAKRLVDVGARQEDKDSARAQVAQAEASLSAAKAALESLKVQEKELEAVRIQAKNAEIALENARLNRSKTRITSLLAQPAVVATRSVEAGEMAAPGMPLLELLDMGTMRLLLRVPSVDVRHIAKGDNVDVTCIGDEPGRVRVGVVHFVAVQAHAQNTTFAVKVELQNDDGSLRAGQMCEARPALSLHRHPLVPRDAVLDTPEGKVVMIDDGGTARERTITIVVERNGVAAIGSGLAEGDRVLVVGQRLARDGDSINVRAERSQVGQEPPPDSPASGPSSQGIGVPDEAAAKE